MATSHEIVEKILDLLEQDEPDREEWIKLNLELGEKDDWWENYSCFYIQALNNTKFTAWMTKYHYPKIRDLVASRITEIAKKTRGDENGLGVEEKTRKLQETFLEQHPRWKSFLDEFNNTRSK